MLNVEFVMLNVQLDIQHSLCGVLRKILSCTDLIHNS